MERAGGSEERAMCILSPSYAISSSNLNLSEPINLNLMNKNTIKKPKLKYCIKKHAWWGRGFSLVVESLPSKHEVLGPVLSSEEKKCERKK